MTGADLIRLAEDLAQCGGIHRLTNCLAAACHVFAEHERRAARTVEAWEDGPLRMPEHGEDWEAGVFGAGMSDKFCGPSETADCSEPGRAPEGAGPFGGSRGLPDDGGVSRPLRAAPASKSVKLFCETIVNPAPLTPERGERMPVPGGITHGPGSPVTAQHHGPSDIAKRCVPKYPEEWR